jgi:hypothetical protein
MISGTSLDAVEGEKEMPLTEIETRIPDRRGNCQVTKLYEKCLSEFGLKKQMRAYQTSQTHTLQYGYKSKPNWCRCGFCHVTKFFQDMSYS